MGQPRPLVLTVLARLLVGRQSPECDKCISKRIYVGRVSCGRFDLNHLGGDGDALVYEPLSAGSTALGDSSA